MQLFVSENSFEKKAALTDNDGTLLELCIQRIFDLNFSDTVEAIITAHAPIKGAWFAKTKNNLDLFIQKSNHPLTIGERVHVFIEKEARLGKCASGKITDTTLESTQTPVEQIKSKYPDALLSNDLTFDWESAEEFILSREIIENNIRLFIDRTAVCWTIDIDSGNSSASFSLLNKKAIPLIARQIILKNMSGLILIDFIGFKDRHQQSILKRELKNALKNDTRVSDIWWTHNGLLEVKRQRTNAAIIDRLCLPNGSFTPETTFIRIQNRLKKQINPDKITIKAHPSVTALLYRYQVPGQIKPDPTCQIDSFELY